MTYHSLAIYYDNQLAENEQKRVPRKTVSQSGKTLFSEDGEHGTALTPFLEEGSAPTCQFLSHPPSSP